MKSQVNALLHVITNGIFKDIIVAYPALEEGLLKDMGRLALYCQHRGIGFFTLDLPNLKALLLEGLEVGRLRLEGPLSRAVSREVRVPRLFAGLWLRVFDRNAYLKHEVDVTALAFLRMLLEFGSKIELECTQDRKSSVMGAYYDVESKLRKPTLGWTNDDLGLAQAGRPFGRSDLGTSNDWYPDGCGSSNESIHAREPRWWDLHSGIYHSCGSHSDYSHLFDGPTIYSWEPLGDGESGASRRRYTRPMHVHLVQALDGSSDLRQSSLPLFREEIEGEDRLRLLEDQRLLRQIQDVADLIVDSFSEYDPIDYSAKQDVFNYGIGFKHGPGAVAEKLKRWEKSHFPNWPLKLQGTFPFELCGKTAQSSQERPLNHEVASRLLGVPKTAKGPRLIAAEPTAHQWCQQLTWKWLREQCRDSFGSDFICFNDQTLSGDLVLAASRDQSLATVDLSDASDRLTCWTVERMFRRNPSLLTALHAARTRYLRDEVSEGGGFLLLRKFASQGTATTFPIMSLTMLFIALGSSLGNKPVTWGNIRKLRDQVRVFGDDIIIPTHGYARLCRAMELLQLKVNKAKSYVNGKFREACGVDGYDGYDVTPTRPRTIVGDSPASCQAVVDTSNNLYMKGYWHASTACIDLLPARLRRGIRIVGPHDVGFSGLDSYSGSDESHLIKRWNSRFHRYEVRVWQLSVRTQERPRDGHAALLDFFASKHNHEHARIVSKFADVRKTRIGLLWEPANSRGYIPFRSETTQHARNVSEEFPKRVRSWQTFSC